MDREVSSASRWEYIDFDLTIRKGSRRKYPVTVRSPEGEEVQEEMRFPFDKGKLENKLLALENALFRSGRGRRRIRSQEEQTVQDFGQSLFEALLVREVRTCYEMSLRAARQQNKGLRLKLTIQPSELAGVPWEFLYDSRQGDFLCLSSKTPIIRHLEVSQALEQLCVRPPLNILGMVASPLDLDGLDVEHEKRLVEEATKDLQANGLVNLTWLEGQTWRDLQQAMRRGSWHIFHFIGHGDFDPSSDEGRIALSDEAGRKRLLKATHLARLLDAHDDLRLVLLNSCEGARGSEGDPFSSTAATLVRRGVPAVVAMQYEISDEAAIEFSRNFYGAVADGLPVDAAVADARTAVSMDSPLEWGTPVLYMRSPDGRIFDISTESLTPVDPFQEIVEGLGREDPRRQYRKSLGSAWDSGELDRHEAERLKDLANTLGLSSSAAADVECEVMGGTIEALLERQKQNAEPNREPETIKATDAARSCAEALGVDLREVRGTGEGGQIRIGDVKKALSHPPQGPPLVSKRVVLSAVVVGLLLVLLTGGMATALTGINPMPTSWRGGPEPEPANDPPADTPLDAPAQEDTPVEEDTEETSSPSLGDLAGLEDIAPEVGIAEPPSPSTVELPDLTGLSPSEAKSKLSDAGLKLGSQDEVSSNDVPKGEIVRQSPAAGKKVEKSSSVDFTVSSGPNQVPVPNVVGSSVANAQGILRKVGFSSTVQTVQSNSPAGTIVSTDPPAGTRQDPSKGVTIRQSSGPSKTPPEPSTKPSSSTSKKDN
jgi:hypothetical protein